MTVSPSCKPLQAFHAHIANNAQACQIMKATKEPMFDQAAARIAAIVEAQRPANRPTIKGLIHDDVDKTTEELHRRIQSLKAKLDKANNTLKWKKTHSREIKARNKKKAKTKWVTTRSQTRCRGLPSPHLQ